MNKTHTFNPWRVDGEKRIIADPYEWGILAGIQIAAKALGERVEIVVEVDPFEDSDEPMYDARGNVIEDRQAGPWTMAHERKWLFNLIDNTPNLDWNFTGVKNPENIIPMADTVGHKLTKEEAKS